MMVGRVVLLFAGMITGAVLVAGCQARKPLPPATPAPPALTPAAQPAEKSPPPGLGAADTRYATPVPTVPPGTPVALPTRPVPNLDIKATKGRPIGPIITHFGAAKADGTVTKPSSVDKSGIETYQTLVGSGFMLVVEAKPGLSNYEVGRSIYSYDENDPSLRPDLQIQSNRPLGDGSELVCDSRKPEIGGIPAIKPPSFKETQRISNTLNDFACRFETFLTSGGACTNAPNGDFSFVKPDITKTQFCMIVARAWAFPVGTTLLSVRLRDAAGNPGPVKKMKIFRPKKVERPKPTRPRRTPTPKTLPTRP